MTTTIKTVKFGQKGIRSASGEYCPVYYSQHRMKSTGKLVITVYAKNHQSMPEILMPENNTDIMTDYFETDKVRFAEGTPEYAALLPFCS